MICEKILEAERTRRPAAWACVVARSTNHSRTGHRGVGGPWRAPAGSPPVSDDLDVAGRLSRSGPVQRGVELAERGDSRREPAPAAQGGGQGVVIPGGEVVVDHLMRSKWWNSDSANLCGGAMALSQPLLASSGGQLQDRYIGRFIGVHLQDGGAAFRELDADLHFMEGRNQSCPLGTELDPDLLFKPSTIHGSLLLTARRPEEPKRYPSRPRNSFAHLAPSTPCSPGPNRRTEPPQGNTCTKQARRVFPRRLPTGGTA